MLQANDSWEGWVSEAVIAQLGGEKGGLVPTTFPSRRRSKGPETVRDKSQVEIGRDSRFWERGLGSRVDSRSVEINPIFLFFLPRLAPGTPTPPAGSCCARSRPGVCGGAGLQQGGAPAY